MGLHGLLQGEFYLYIFRPPRSHHQVFDEYQNLKPETTIIRGRTIRMGQPSELCDKQNNNKIIE
jgi:hypothetical protein